MENEEIIKNIKKLSKEPFYDIKSMSIELGISRKFIKEVCKNNDICIPQNRSEIRKRSKYRLLVSRHDYLVEKGQVIFLLSNGYMKCKDCGEINFDLLTIDHKNGGGSRIKKNTGLSAIMTVMIELNKGILDIDNYDIICHNCQHLRALNNCYKSRTWNYEEFKDWNGEKF